MIGLESDRNITCIVGKKGVLDYYESFYKHINTPELEIKNNLEKLEKITLEGSYQISKLGVTKL